MFSPRGENPEMWQIPTPPSHNSWGNCVHLSFGGHGYPRLLLQPPDIGPSLWNIYLHPLPGVVWCVRSQPFGKSMVCSLYFLKNSHYLGAKPD